MNLKFSVLNNLTKDLQKTDICGNLVFTWPLYWMPEIVYEQQKSKMSLQCKLKDIIY